MDSTEYYNRIERAWLEATKRYMHKPCGYKVFSKRDDDEITKLSNKKIPLRYVLAAIREGIATHRKNHPLEKRPPAFKYIVRVLETVLSEAKGAKAAGGRPDEETDRASRCAKIAETAAALRAARYVLPPDGDIWLTEIADQFSYLCSMVESGKMTIGKAEKEILEEKESLIKAIENEILQRKQNIIYLRHLADGIAKAEKMNHLYTPEQVPRAAIFFTFEKLGIPTSWTKGDI